MEATAERDGDSRRNDRALPLPPRAAGRTRPPPELEPGPGVQPPDPEAGSQSHQQYHGEVAAKGAEARAEGVGARRRNTECRRHRRCRSWSKKCRRRSSG